MKNRFECLIKGLRDLGDDVQVFTPCVSPPKEYHGAKVTGVLGFRLPFYKSPTLLLSLGLSIRVFWHLIMSRPDVIHVSSPGLIVFAAILYAKMLDLPLVVSYHTHIPEYIPKYTWKGLVSPMWSIIRFCTRMADLTLVTSLAMKQELTANRCTAGKIDVWQRGVDTHVFNPRFRSPAMRARMTDGNPDAPILTYIGRLGAEKNLYALKGILGRLPGARLCFVGDGPERQQLEQHFAGMPVTFTGMLQGEDLSAAYASADVFMMPSESETLGFVVLEAMASGLPVVAVAAGGLTDIINRPGTTGYLYPPGDYDRAVELTQQLLQSQERRQTIGAAARAEVERWGWGAATRRLRDQQYMRAIRKNLAKRWFGWVAIRYTIARGLQNLFSAVLAVVAWIAARLDYARPYRAQAAISS
ncbi:hypothetical protein WJX72_001700 [[Myrmecia] bisecta]|uniref:Uncharacterized protein n=1 Tax=[Myrmecia] bisecta TaxID=41462 RepID=A0AAW1QQ95_9CHLO